MKQSFDIVEQIFVVVRLDPMVRDVTVRDHVSLAEARVHMFPVSSSLKLILWAVQNNYPQGPCSYVIERELCQFRSRTKL